MHHKVLNNKYEKFLEDCNIRRKRNDIILRSLCRVEDKAKAIFAKTERLKLLKVSFSPWIIQCTNLNQSNFRSAFVLYHTKFHVIQNLIH